MTNTKTMLAMLALGAAVTFAGPAFAEKMKATLDGKSEVPPNASTGSGTADIDYDAATKKLTWKLTYSGLSGPATAAHFHGPGWGTCVPDTPVNGMIPTRSPATGFAMSARRLTYALFAEQSDIAPQFEQISLRQQPNF